MLSIPEEKMLSEILDDSLPPIPMEGAPKVFTNFLRDIIRPYIREVTLIYTLLEEEEI
jgi:hypothetical protein